tara:strand:- start:58 stop:996 length:939 start_codon:yes stop_codon:yes gene_type:complete
MKNNFFLFLFSIIILLIFNIKLDIPIENILNKYKDNSSKFITIDQMNVHYKDEGVGVPIILIHGTGSSLHTWDDWAEKLKNEYRVIRMDLPAFGLTGPNKTNNYRLEYYKSFLETFIEKLELEQFILVGNSLGGSIAWYYSSYRVNKVNKLVLIDPGGFESKIDTPFIFKLAKTPLLNKILRYITPKYFIEKSLKEVYYDDKIISSKLVDRYHDLTLREGNRAAFISRANYEKVDHTIRLKKITVPTLILWGKEDIWISYTDGKKFLDLIPNSELVIMEKVGHVPMEEKPNESRIITLDFIKRTNSLEKKIR